MADQAHLVTIVIIGQADWSQALAVVVCLLPKGLNLGMSLSHHPSLVVQPQEVVVMMHFGALSSWQLVQERGNKRQNYLVRWICLYKDENFLVAPIEIPALKWFYHILYMCTHYWTQSTATATARARESALYFVRDFCHYVMLLDS